jgi:hypothetical protein
LNSGNQEYSDSSAAMDYSGLNFVVEQDGLSWESSFHSCTGENNSGPYFQIDTNTNRKSGDLANLNGQKPKLQTSVGTGPSPAFDTKDQFRKKASKNHGGNFLQGWNNINDKNLYENNRNVKDPFG